MTKKLAIIIFFIRTFCSVGFGVVYSSLVLFLIQSMSFSEAKAISFTGMLIALHYSLSALSGMILGRWISNINALILGTVFQIISLPIIYHYRNMDMMIWGCTFFLLGSLLSSPTINIIITERFESKDQAREKAFMWNYAGMNLGNITGFSVAGYFQLKDSFSDMSYIPMFVMSLALILCIAYRKKLCDIHTAYSQYNINEKINNLIKTLVLTVCIGIVIKYILLYSYSLSNILMVFLIIMFIGFLILNFKKASDKNNAYMFTILAFSYLVFWSLYFLIPTGLTLFATYNTTGRIFDFSIPPEWLSNINSLLIIIGAPLLAIFLKN